MLLQPSAEPLWQAVVFDACRFTQTAAQFWATCINTRISRAFFLAGGQQRGAFATYRRKSYPDKGLQYNAKCAFIE
jgi:hypothetical protein